MGGSGRLVILGLACSILFVAIGVVWLSLSAETLDRVAEELGALEAPIWSPPIPDYEVPGLEGSRAASIAVGVAFTIIAFAAAWAVGKALKRRE